jgi:hypothetical protein
MVDFYKCQGITKSGRPCCNMMKFRDVNDKRFCCKHLDQESAYNTTSSSRHNISLDDECLDDECFHYLLEQLSLLEGNSSITGNHHSGFSETPLPSVPIPQEDCSICMEKMCRSTFVVTVCAHKFHSTCLNKWSETGNVTCPLCRINIV